MQLVMNIKMKEILQGGADLSILHKSQTYDWNPRTLDELVENDPNPDADVRFFETSKNKSPIISPFSFLNHEEKKKKTSKKKVVIKQEMANIQLALVGTYQHICICLIHRNERRIEFFDSRGPNFDLKQIKSFFAARFEGFTFENANPDFDIQAEDAGAPQADEKARDIFCHTWIYLYSYRRIILQQDSMDILRSLVLLTASERLAEIKRFQEWLYSYNTGNSTIGQTFTPRVPPRGRGYLFY